MRQRLATAALALALGASAAQAAWPERPVHVIVPFAAGGITDVVARIMAERLQTAFKQAFVVENEPGAAGTLAAQRLARARPDGYMLMSCPVSQITINSMYDTYNDKYPKAAADFAAAKAVLADIEKIFVASGAVHRFFKSQAHLYTLFIVVYQQQALKKTIPIKKWATKLEEFAKLYVSNKRPAIVDKYRAAATEGTQKRSNREERVARLKEWIFSD